MGKLSKKNVLLFLSIFFLFGVVNINKIQATIIFEDVTESSGVSHISRSFGAAWGDFNGDGHPDLFTDNHQSKPCLFLNKGDGTFEDVYDEYVGDNDIFVDADQHGVAWADFDNDGDQDFVVIVGGNGGGITSPKNANQLYRNETTKFVEVAFEKGISLSNARGRSPLWLDFDHDGWLDLAVANLVSFGTPKSTIFRQESGQFIDVGIDVGFQFTENTNVFQIADLTLNNQIEIVGLSPIYGIFAQEFTERPFVNVTNFCIDNPSQARGNGVVIADFDNDFREDIFVPLGSKPLELNQVASNEIHFAMVVSDEIKELGFSFTTHEAISFEMAAPWFSLSDVFIGEEGKHPFSWIFTLDPTDATNHGIVPYEPNIDRGIFIGYDHSTSMWKVVLNTDYVNPGAMDDLHGIILGTSQITNPTTFGFDQIPAIWKNKILINENSLGLTDKSGEWNIGDQIPSYAAVAGDFDNDMDIDLYVVNSLPTSNYPNTLYENTGGVFQKINNAGGAAGVSQGIGQNVVTADYDEDGFLDLYVMNGGGTAPFADYGFHQLFRNTGNQNNWIEIDLVGLISNRDAIGAEIFVTTKGVTQKRRQTGQMHYYSQDYKRIHFGLASNQSIDELKIIWPDSQIQNLLNVASNRIIKVYEPSADMDRDNDVDGKDLYAYIQILQENTYVMTISDFSNNFGK